MLASLAVAAFATTASAAVPNLARHSSTSPSNSFDKSRTVACPAGRNLTGVGGDITGANGAVLVDDLTPNPTRTQNTTTGFEINAYAPSWFLRSYAMCANPLAGATRVTASSASNSLDSKSVTAACPVGKQLTGAGADVTGGVGEVVMDDLRPNGNPPTSATVTGFEVDPYAANWSVRAYALCANPLAGLERRVATSASNSSNKSITATCPAGKRVVGLGGEITGGLGEAVVDDYTPSAALTSVTVTGREAVDNDGPYGGNWSVRAYAVCATP